jgi:hypothetical protein
MVQLTVLLDRLDAGDDSAREAIGLTIEAMRYAAHRAQNSQS